MKMSEKSEKGVFLVFNQQWLNLGAGFINEQWVVSFYAGNWFYVISHHFLVEGGIFWEHAMQHGVAT